MSDHTPDFTVVGEEWARGPRSRNSVISSVSEPEACLEAEARAFADKIGDSWAEPHRTPPTCGLGPRVQTLDPSRRAQRTAASVAGCRCRSRARLSRGSG